VLVDVCKTISVPVPVTILGGGFPPADSPPLGRRISTSRLPSSWEEGLGVEEKNTVATYF